MTRCTHCIYSILFIVLAFQGQAQFVSTYTTENSPLPFNTIRCLEHEGQVLWIGTDEGLAKLENQDNWTVFNTTNSPLWNDDIRALKTDGDSLLWIGTVQGGLFKFNGEQWTNYTPENSGLGDYLIRDIDIDQEGNIWVATTEGLYLFDRLNWSSWSMENGLLSNNISAICIDTDKKYIGTINGGVLYFDAENSYTNHTIADSGIPDNTALNIELDSDGKPWFISPAAGLVMDQGIGGPWVAFNTSNSGMPSNSLLCLKHGTNGVVYIGSETGGVIAKSANDYSQITMSNSNLTDNHILCIEKGNEGGLWAGTFDGGLCKIDYTASLESEKESSLAVYPTVLKPSQTLYFSTNVSANYKLSNALGMVLKRGDLINKRQIVLPKKMSTGCVYLEVKTKNKTWYRKILITE